MDNYKFIPIGFSIGGLFALYFCQKYTSQCLHCILLDPTLWTPNNMKLRLNNIYNYRLNKSNINYKQITNKKFKKMLQDWKDCHTDIEDMYLINDISHMIRSSYFSKHLKLKLSVPTTSFVNIEKPEKQSVPKDFNNKTKLNEIKILEKHNPDKYKAFVFINKTHYVFYDIQPATKIIKYMMSLKKFKSEIKIRNFNKFKIYSIMQRDKKNRNNKIKFVLLIKSGEIVLDCEADRNMVLESIEYGLNYFAK